MRLHINIDHVATIRQARRTDEPDPVRAAVLVEQGGADGVTVHLREDRRHIQDRDVRLLMETVRTGVNLEIAATDAMVSLAVELAPMAVTLVPENREEITTEGGLDLGGGVTDRVTAAVEAIREAGVRTALFIDPDPDALHQARDTGTDAVELHTGEYANAWRVGRGAPVELDRLQRAAALGRSLGLDVHAGHGLTYENVAPVASIAEIEELNIGHSVVSRSVFQGIEAAVRAMKTILMNARRDA
ncbi:MAG: pyridoxine 5'-phosphate synthase [Longimicrobiales bacterium]|nr:pyridoxine 5'-phosphate synthase [Longimicrobiales bacterium]